LAIPAYRFGRDVAQNRFEIFPPSENFIELKMQGLGASAGIELSEKWSAGLTLAYQRLDYRGNSTLIFPDPRVLFPEVNFPPREIEAIEPFIGQTFAVIDVDGEDEALAIYGGLLFTPSDRFRIGLSFKRQPDFDYSYLTSGRDDDFNLVPEESGNASFAIPDNYALGFSFQATDSVLLSVELNRVLYSQLSDEFVAFFSSDQDPSRATQTAADATEYHVGLEYFIATLQYPLALRMGYWFEPYHALQNTSLDTQLLYRYFDEDIGNYLQGSRPTVFLQRFAHDLNHFTVGFGMTLNNRVVLDLSGDIDEENTSISFSSIYRF
jgi:long-subunit fatty acid transport protein